MITRQFYTIEHVLRTADVAIHSYALVGNDIIGFFSRPIELCRYYYSHYHYSPLTTTLK